MLCAWSPTRFLGLEAGFAAAINLLRILDYLVLIHSNFSMFSRFELFKAWFTVILQCLEGLASKVRLSLLWFTGTVPKVLFFLIFIDFSLIFSFLVWLCKELACWSKKENLKEGEKERKNDCFHRNFADWMMEPALIEKRCHDSEQCLTL